MKKVKKEREERAEGSEQTKGFGENGKPSPTPSRHYRIFTTPCVASHRARKRVKAKKILKSKERWRSSRTFRSLRSLC